MSEKKNSVTINVLSWRVTTLRGTKMQLSHPPDTSKRAGASIEHQPPINRVLPCGQESC